MGKCDEHMPMPRAVMHSALLLDFVNNCKKCLKDFNPQSPAEQELTNVRIRTKEGTEIICVTVTEYTFVVIQNCTGKPWSWGEEDGAPGGGGEGGGCVLSRNKASI